MKFEIHTPQQAFAELDATVFAPMRDAMVKAYPFAQTFAGAFKACPAAKVPATPISAEAVASAGKANIEAMVASSRAAAAAAVTAVNDLVDRSLTIFNANVDACVAATRASSPKEASEVLTSRAKATLSDVSETISAASRAGTAITAAAVAPLSERLRASIKV